MSEKKQSIWEAYKFSILLIGAILIGSLIGTFWRSCCKIKTTWRFIYKWYVYDSCAISIYNYQ